VLGGAPLSRRAGPSRGTDAARAWRDRNSPNVRAKLGVASSSGCEGEASLPFAVRIPYAQLPNTEPLPRVWSGTASRVRPASDLSIQLAGAIIPPPTRSTRARSDCFGTGSPQVTRCQKPGLPESVSKWRFSGAWGTRGAVRPAPRGTVDRRCIAAGSPAHRSPGRLLEHSGRSDVQNRDI